MFYSSKLRTLISRFSSLVLLSSFIVISASASLVVVQNSAPAATSWPGSPILSTAANPNTTLTVGESYSAANNYTQTFTVPATNNYTLQSIGLFVGGGTGTTASATVTVNLYDLGAQTAPNPSAYAAGFNLLGGGNGLPLNYSAQSNGILQLNFTGSDQVYLVSGHLYAFELAGVSGTTPLTWYRNTSDTYPAGAAYRNRSWINGNSARDFGLAVYAVVNTNPPPPTSCVVDPSTTFQQVDGFGAGAVFLDAGVTLTDANMDALYGSGPNQMGLNLLRVRIAPVDGAWSDAIQPGQLAAARGAKILATPWTPPASMKTNNDIAHGSLLPSAYADFAAYLNKFTDTMRASGAPVSVVSLQNEPDYDPDYEGCQWSASQFLAFCHDFASLIKTPVIMPESFAYVQSVSDATLNDPVAAANVDYVGGHLYGATIQDYPLAHSLGKHTWMTEYLVNDQTIEAAMGTAQQVSDCLTVANMSAYIWWKTIDDDNGLLTAAGVLQRRAYVMAQFSRFALPGDVRIAVTQNSSTLGISAFRSMDGARYSVIAVNNSSASVTHMFTLQGLAPSSITPYVTSGTQSLEAQNPLTLDMNNAFTYTIPAYAIVTFAMPTTSPLSVTQRGYVYNRRTNRLVQQITVTNNSSSAVSGPIRVSLAGLTNGISLLNSAGTTTYAPGGNPYVVVTSGGLAAGASATGTLEFSYTGAGVTYTPQATYGIATP